MSNFQISNLPQRTAKEPFSIRTNGLTMVMDKGLSIRQVEDLITVSSQFIDLVKLGWCTSYLTPDLATKIKLYHEANIKVYLGGTLFEAFLMRNQFNDYRRLLDKYGLAYAEVSDGSITIDHDKKCEYIRILKEQATVLSEVGSKDDKIIMPPYKWINLIRKELAAGAWKIIGEARESGNVGLFRKTGEVRTGLVEEILSQIAAEQLIWEAPQKNQQVWFINLIGSNANLGNIKAEEVIPLETMRLGLRGDTFHHFLS